MNGRGQAFILDYVVSLFLFIVVLVTGIVLLADIVPDESFELVYREHTFLADQLLSPGFPLGWNASNVIVPGIANDNRINATLLSSMNNLSYDQVKSLYQLSTDFVVVLRNQTTIINLTTSCGYGKNITYDFDCEPQWDALSYDHLVSSSRIVIFEGRVLELSVYNWG